MERRTLAIVIFCLSLVSGCTPAPSAISNSSPEHSDYQKTNLYEAPANLSQILYKVKRATYLVECPQGQGSAWGYLHKTMGGDSAVLVTNHHVIASCLEEDVDPTISNSRWEEFTAEVTAWANHESDPDEGIADTDLAILKPLDFEISTLEDYSTTYSQGLWVMISAYPGVDPDFFTHVVTTGNISVETNYRGVIMTASVNPGASGGVVVNALGEVLGTIYASTDDEVLNDVGLFLDMQSLWNLIREASLGQDPS